MRVPRVPDSMLVKQLLVAFERVQVKCLGVGGAKGDVLLKTGNKAICVVRLCENVATMVFYAWIIGIVCKRNILVAIVIFFLNKRVPR